MSINSNLKGTFQDDLAVGAKGSQVKVVNNGGRFEVQHLGEAADEPMLMAIARATGEPSGFPNRTDSIVTYSAVTRRFTIAPKAPAISFNVWRSGKVYNYTTSQSPLAHADTTGVYFFYINSVGTFVVTNTVWDLSVDIPIYYALYNTDLNGGGTNDAIPCEERHGIVMDWATHRNDHFAIGAHVESGFAASGYVLNSDVNANIGFALDTGDIADEDIVLTIPAKAESSYTVLYRLNGNGDWNWYLSEPFPFKYAGGGLGNIQYNQLNVATWQLTQVTNNNTWVNVYVCATNADPSLPAFQVVCIPGQKTFTTLAAAQAESILGLSFGNLPFQEIAPLYQITYRYNTGYGSTGKVRIESFTKVIGTRLSSSALLAGAHNSLSGRDVANTHPATAIGYDNTVTLLTAENVQAAIDELISNTVFKEVANVIIEKSTAYDNSFIIGSSMMDDETSGNQDKRMFFDHVTGSFRAGCVLGNEWDSANRGAYSIVLGYGGKAYGTNTCVVGTENGIATGNYSSMIGGASHEIVGRYSFVAGGTGSKIYNTNSVCSTIIGSTSSIIGAVALAAENCFIAGGGNHQIGTLSLSGYSAIVGGNTNFINAYDSFIGAGNSHSIINSYAVAILGGYDGTLGSPGAGDGSYSGMIGGYGLVLGSVSSSKYSGMIAGHNNIINADYAVALGGFTNEIDQHYSIALGRYAKTHWWGSIAQASGRPGAVSGAAQEETVVLRQTVTGLSSTIMYPDANPVYPLTLLTKHVYAFRITVVCAVSASSVATVGDAAMYVFEGLARNKAGTSVLLTCNKTVIYEDTALAAICDANVTVADASDTLVVTIMTGVDATLSLNCVATINATIVAYV